MLKRILCVLVLVVVMICGCRGNENVLSMASSEIKNGSIPVINDAIKDIDNEVLLMIAKNYIIVFDFNSSFQEGDVINYERAYRFIKYGGVYCEGNSNYSIRPELKQYYNKEKGIFVLPAQIADGYISGKFHTVLDRSKITEYDAANDVYMFEPFTGEFYYALSIESQTIIDDTTMRFICILTPEKDVWDDNTNLYRYIFTVRFTKGEYQYLSVEILIV